MKYVLDSRFFIEFYYSTSDETRQKASRKMKELVNSKTGIVPTIVICETVRIICSREGKQKADMTYISITTSGLRIESLSPLIAKEAGLIKSGNGEVPMGDCIVAATAHMNQARILSDDPHFDSIKETKRTWL